jgi:hypothetical protein
MKDQIICAALVAAFFLSLPVSASPLEDKVEALKKAITAEGTAKASVSPNSPQSSLYANAAYLAANLDQLTAQMDNPNAGNNAEAEIRQILTAFSSEEVRKAGQELLDEIHLERKTRADAAAAESEALLKRVSDTVAKAQKPEDVDGILADLQKFQSNGNGGYNPENQALYQQVSSAFQFTKLWQDYLSHLATGQTQLAIGDLQSLSQDNYGVGIIPRSQILERLTALKTAPPTTSTNTAGVTPSKSPVENILKGIKTLDDMEPALEQLAALRSNDAQAQQAYYNVAPLAQIYTSVKAGLPLNTNLNFANSNNGNGPGVSPDVQAELLVFVLQHYFDSYKGTPPAPDEKPPAFVNRVISDAISREDWALLKKAISAQTYLNQNSIPGVYSGSAISGGVDNLLAGLNQEAASQYALAVFSYENALKVPDATVPAKLIGDKLAAIQKDHPKEFEDGMQMVLSPPTPRYYPGMNPAMYPGMYPGMPYRPGMPGYPGTPQSVLSIPGATTNQMTAPAPPTTRVAPPASATTNQPPTTPVPPAKE